MNAGGENRKIYSFFLDEDTHDIIRGYALRHHKSMSQSVTDWAWEASDEDENTVSELQHRSTDNDRR